MADALNELKRSSGYSYQQIGEQAHLGRSTVHRYCSGQSRSTWCRPAPEALDQRATKAPRRAWTS
ncbi:helix-turn-helix domain-containing protein [Saccharopolyspora sp. NPDC002376]